MERTKEGQCTQRTGTEQIPEKRHEISQKELWIRYGNNDYTIDDLAMILDIVRDEDNLQEFYEVSNWVWNNTPPATEEQQEVFRREVAQLIASYERSRKIQPKRVSLLRPGGRFRKIWYAAAAVLLLGLLIPLAYLYNKPHTAQIVTHYVEIVTQRGEIKTVILPDLTEVTLNVESRIKYPSRFSGHERPVELVGQASFHVVSDPERPFTIHTENMDIQVLGTVFDVKAYTEDVLSSVSVLSGKVKVSLSGGTVEKPCVTSQILEKNQQLKMDKTTGKTEKMTIDVDKYMLWKDGTLYFYRTPIRDVVNILNRHFHQVDIVLTGGEYKNLITGSHHNESPEAILKSIVSTTGLKCKKEGNRYTLFN